MSGAITIKGSLALSNETANINTGSLLFSASASKTSADVVFNATASYPLNEATGMFEEKVKLNNGIIGVQIPTIALEQLKNLVAGDRWTRIAGGITVTTADHNVEIFRIQGKEDLPDLINKIEELIPKPVMPKVLNQRECDYLGVPYAGPASSASTSTLARKMT